MFKTSESGGKGQLLDGDPSYVTNDKALVKNLKLNYKVVYGGSETALIQSFRQAEQNKKPLSGLLLRAAVVLPGDEARQGEPAAVHGRLRRRPGQDRLRLPAVRPEQDRRATKFANAGSPAVELVKNFQWTNDDQNAVARSIAVDKMSPDDAAKKWVDANPDKVKAWLPAGVS